MQEKNQKLVKNTIIIFISKFCTQFLSFFILPLLTAVLTTEEYGAFDLINTYGWLIVPYMSFQLENGIFRFLIDTRENIEESKKVITNGIFSIIIQLIIFSIIYFGLMMFLHIENNVYIYIYAITTLFLNVALYITRGFGDNLSYAKSSIISGVSNVLICVVAVYFCKLGLIGLVIAMSISNILGGMYLYLKKNILKYFSLKLVNKDSSKGLIKYSLPLVPNMTSSWITNVSDKMMISLFIGVSANGIYSISTKFSVLLSHIFSVFNLSWTETASLSANDNDRDEFYSKTVDNIYSVCSCICFLIVAAMPIIFKIMINDKFKEAYFYIPWLIIGSIFELFSGLLGAIYISLKKSKNIAISTLIAGIINILINLIFMKYYGIITACVSTIISYAVLSLYRIIDIKKYVKLKLNYKIYIYSAILLVILILLYQSCSITISIISIIITTIFAIILNKNIIISCKRKFYSLIKNRKAKR